MARRHHGNHPSSCRPLHPPAPPVDPGGTAGVDQQRETAVTAAAETALHRSSPTNVLVTPDTEPQNEPAIGIDLLDPRIMVAAANDYRETGASSRLGIYRSTDGGFQWTNFLPPLPPGHVASGDPVVVFGYPHLCLVGGAAYGSLEGEEGGGSIVVYRSDDAGAAFEGPIIIQQGFDEQTFNDKPWFAVDTGPASPYLGRAYVAYTRFMDPGTIILFQRSEDGGRTWSTPLPLTGIEPYALGTFVAVGREGEVYVAWMEGNPETTLWFRRSLDGGLTFEPAVVIARFTAPVVEEGLREIVPEFTFRVFTLAFLGVDTTTGPKGGLLYAVWQQLVATDHDEGPGFTIDVMISVSRDRGQSWSRSRKATDTPPRAVAFFPFISVSPKGGTVNIVYYTNRVDPEKLDVYLARAVKHGRDWLPDERVTSVSFDPNADPLGEVFIGDYIGVQAKPKGKRATAVWCDTRRGNEDIFAAPKV